MKWWWWWWLPWNCFRQRLQQPAHYILMYDGLSSCWQYSIIIQYTFTHHDSRADKHRTSTEWWIHLPTTAVTQACMQVSKSDSHSVNQSVSQSVSECATFCIVLINRRSTLMKSGTTLHMPHPYSKRLQPTIRGNRDTVFWFRIFDSNSTSHPEVYKQRMEAQTTLSVSCWICRNQYQMI